MLSERISSEVNITISRADMDKFDDLAQKYADSPKGFSQDAERAFELKILKDQELAHKTEELFSTLAKKNREIEKYAVLLESLEPVPGINPDKILQLIENGNKTDLMADYRDVKIVSLAKKCRALNLSLMKERTYLNKKEEECKDWERQCEHLKKELDLVSSPAARAAAAKSVRQNTHNNADVGGIQDPDSTAITELRETKKQLNQVSKQLEEMRRKYCSSQDECKKLERVLIKEIGEGVELDQALSDGWKGRAQQIIMLKSKLKRLEQQSTNSMMHSQDLLGGGGGGGGGGMSTIMSGAGGAGGAGGGSVSGTVMSKDYTTHTSSSSYRRNDVDSKAEADLSIMHYNRQQAIELITEDRARLAEQCDQLEKKNIASKARIKALEADHGKYKEQLKTMLEKTDTDDQLIAALRQEIERLRAQLKKMSVDQKLNNQDHHSQTVQRSQRINDGKVVSTTTTTAGSSVEYLEAENRRLTRLCTSQSDQLSTQENLIKNLRTELSKKK